MSDCRASDVCDVGLLDVGLPDWYGASSVSDCGASDVCGVGLLDVGLSACKVSDVCSVRLRV